MMTQELYSYSADGWNDKKRCISNEMGGRFMADDFWENIPYRL